jgi:uncharacterized membrane protein
VIYGLAAALGWGLADFLGAVSSRRIGSFAAVVSGQLLSAAFMTIVFAFAGGTLGSIHGLLWFVALNGVASMIAYASHFRALQLGPVAVVSPIGAGYAVVGVVLSFLILGERPSAVAVVGMVVVVVGTMLVTTDIRALRAGLHERAPGLPWAFVSALTFGVAGFLLGYTVKRSGDWIVALWASRVALVTAFAPFILIRRKDLRAVWPATGLGVGVALLAGLADILGVTSYSAGAQAGFVSIVLAASAVFPVVAVALSVRLLGERLVLNQLAGIALVVGGLLMLGLGST